MSQSPYAPPPPAPSNVIGGRWHHQINRWLVLNISALNAIVFLLICVAGLLYAVWGLTQMDYLEAYTFVVVFSGLVGFPLAGIIYCGLIALLVETASQSRRTAELLDKRFQR